HLFHNGFRIENQDRLLFTDFGSSRYSTNILEPLAHRLDNDFLLSCELIHDQAHLLVAGTDDHDEDFFAVIRILQMKYLANPDERKCFVPQVVNLLAVYGLKVTAPYPHGFSDRTQGNRVLVAANLHDQSLHDRQGDRQGDFERRTLSFFRENVE